MFCSKCGIQNADEANFCTGCGNGLQKNVTDSNTVNNVATDDGELEIEGKISSKVTLYNAILGSNKNNTDYYLSVFDQFDSGGSSMSWHWPAFLISFYWFLYRKMWVPALLYFMLPILFQIIVYVSGENIVVSVSITLIYLAAVFVWVPMYANKLYYNQVNSTVTSLATDYAAEDNSAYMEALKSEGGTSVLSVVFGFILAIIAGTYFASSFDMASYSNLGNKAKDSEYAVIATQAKRLVEVYMVEHTEWPRNEGDAGFDIPVSMIGVMDVVIKNGVIQIGVHAQPDESARLIPNVNQVGYIIWKCENNGIDTKYLPAECNQ